MRELVPATPACDSCGADLSASSGYRRFRVCETCGKHFWLPARERLDILLDPGSFREIHEALTGTDPLVFTDQVPYSDRLERARDRTGLEEAVIAGTGRINGADCVIAAFEFEFLGGSMGTVVGEKITLAMELACDRRVPFICVAASGGARMQEGMLSLVQMAKTAAAATRLEQEGVPFISVLAHPTTGGVYASFASLGGVILAESRALIGFAGPRVIEQITGRKQTEDAQTAETLAAHGQIDAVVDRAQLRNTLAMLLQLLKNPWSVSTRGEKELYRPSPRSPASAWEAVELARHSDRPTSRDFIRAISPQFFELHGDRLAVDDRAVVCGLGDLGGITVMWVAQERGRSEDERQATRGGRMGPEGYRKAARAVALASAWRVPVVTLIDTPGAALDEDSEARGLAPAIARCLSIMSTASVPVVAAVIGEGGSGGALALGVADRILMLENAIYSVIAPEGAAAILYHDAQRARDLADALRLTAHDCQILGVVDTVVPEPDGGAQKDGAYAAVLLKNFVLDALLDLRRASPQRLREDRYRKFRRMGQPPTASRRASIARELDELQRRVGSTLSQVLDRSFMRERTQPSQG
ncbi:MAG: acetyl-CoA carboxylase carboxyltransferase subunit alpha/beta [Chloroflexota bacterium]